MIEYQQLTYEDLQNMDNEKTFFFMSVSPLEVHGPHLPLGTDITVADEVLLRSAKFVKENYPGSTAVRLPPLYLGADALPLRGSLPVPAVALEKTVLSFAEGLYRQGFRFLFISDNHGGPRHQLALSAAAQKAWKKYNFYIIYPFGMVYKMMVHQDMHLIKETGLEPGQYGDDSDSHAGTNETSLMLAVEPESVRPIYSKLPATKPPPVGKFYSFLARLAGVFSPSLGRDLKHLFNLLAWVNAEETASYIGAPAAASKEAGEAMLQLHVNISVDLLDRAIKGEKPQLFFPMLWSLRFLRFIP